MDDLNEKFIRCAQDVIGLMKAVDHSVVLLEKEFRRRFIGERFEYYEVEKVDEYKYTAGKFHRDMAGFKSSYELNLFLLESNLVPTGSVQAKNAADCSQSQLVFFSEQLCGNNEPAIT